MPVDAPEVVEVADNGGSETTPQTDLTASSAFDAIVAGLQESRPVPVAADPEPEDSETPPVPQDTADDAAEPPAEQQTEEQKRESRRGKGFERRVAEVQAQADAKVSEAQAERDRIIAEYEATRAEKERLEAEQQAQQQQTAKLLEQYTAWVGAEQDIAALEAEIMKSDTQVTDWDAHENAKARLRDLKERRAILPLLEAQKRAEAWGQIAGEFTSVAADLPEAARTAYSSQKSIPEAIRYYAKTLLDAQKEEYEGEIAELKAENDRLKARPNGRSPEVGGLGGAPRMGLDYKTASPEALMAEGLAANARAAARGRR